MEGDTNKHDHNPQTKFKTISHSTFPYEYSGKNFIVTEQDESILKEMRDFASVIFKSQIPHKLYSQIDKDAKDCNMLCKVLKIYEPEGDEYRMRIKEFNERKIEKGKTYDVIVDSIKYSEFEQNQMIRVKSAEKSTSEESNSLKLKPYTSLLKFLNYSYIQKVLSDTIQDTEINKVIWDSEEPTNAIQITEENPNWKYTKQATILQIWFPEESKLIEEKKNTQNDNAWI